MCRIRCVQDLEKDPDVVPPLFVTEFQLDPMRLQFYPNEDEFQEELAEIITAFQQTLMQNQNLVADRYFDAFTQSVTSNIRLVKSGADPAIGGAGGRLPLWAWLYVEIVVTRCQILRLKCTKFDFGWGSAPDPTRGAYSASPDPLAGIKGAYF